MMFVKANGNLTLNNVTTDGEGVSVWMRADGNASVTINSGNYSSDNSHVVYSMGGGKITINGGTFGKPGQDNKEWILNIEDSARRKVSDNRELIEVKGGEFWNFDPSNNTSEGNPTNYVADGYTVNVENVGEDKLYKVVLK